MKWDAVFAMLQLEPSGAEPENQPSAADDIHRRRHLGQHCRMPVGIAGYHQAETYALRRHRERGQCGPSLEARPRRIGKDRQEVVESPGGVIAEGIDVLPKREE